MYILQQHPLGLSSCTELSDFFLHSHQTLFCNQRRCPENLPSKRTLNFAKFEAIDLLEIFLLHLGCGKDLQYMPLFLPHLVATPYLM